MNWLNDLKYKTKIEERQYTDDTIEELVEDMWQKITECIKIDDVKGKGSVLLLEKLKPYSCNKGDYLSKDGIHLIFPDLLIDKSAYKKIISLIQDDNTIKQIFTDTSEIGPDNDTKQILDSSFSSWQLYGCGKRGESPYLVTKVFQISDDGFPDEVDKDEFYGPKNILEMASMCYREKNNIVYQSEFEKTFKQKNGNKSSSNMTEDIYNIRINSTKPEEIQTLIYSVGKENGYTSNLREWFKLIYEVLFGELDGPRMGFFVSFFGIKETIQLINDKVK